MSNLAMSTLMTVAPDCVERAQRLDFAIELLRRNVPEEIVRKRVAVRFNCHRQTAWRTVGMAKDLA